MDDELCFCGSGRLHGRCHGMPRRARRARRIELEVLGELHDAAFLFPFLRPKDSFIDEFAWRVVAGMGEEQGDTLPAEVAEGLAILPTGERSRIVRMLSGRYSQLWESLCRKVGDTPLTEATLVASAVRGAVADRVGPRRELVAELDEGALDGSPAAAVAFVIPPELVWGYEEALWGPPMTTRAHVARTRAQARRLGSWLPVEGLPRASGTLLRGCESVADDEIARGVTELLFDKYTLLVQSRATYVSLRN
jgi:SEC-C motif